MPGFGDFDKTNKDNKKICGGKDSQDALIRCGKCGGKVAAGSLFCPICGNSLANVLISVDDSEAPSEPAVNKKAKAAEYKKKVLQFIKKHKKAFPRCS